MVCTSTHRLVLFRIRIKRSPSQSNFSHQAYGGDANQIPHLRCNKTDEYVKQWVDAHHGTWTKLGLELGLL